MRRMCASLWPMTRRARFAASSSTTRCTGTAKVFGYSANIVRCDEQRFGRLATAVHMTAMEKFTAEGKETLNLLLAPFVKLERGKYNDDWGAKLFLTLQRPFRQRHLQLQRPVFPQIQIPGVEKSLYVASNNLLVASNDLYLAFVSADVTRQLSCHRRAVPLGHDICWQEHRSD